MESTQNSFVVSARKYRPNDWDEVIGQQSITETLKTSIAENHLAHAYLFCGPRGVGKTTCARIFAREINKTDGKKDSDFSFNVFELDAASNNKVDDIRQLTDQVRIPPQVGKYKVYIIDEVHMLTQQAFNAFLKTLEEPPKHAIFILATTEKHKIIPTILSRCQIYDFNRISVNEIVNQLQSIASTEKITAEDEALHTIAQKADGAMRDALSIFDQLVSYTRGNLTHEAVLKNLHVLDHEYYFSLTHQLIAGDYAAAMLSLDEILKLGFDPIHFISGLGSHFRDLLMSQNPKTAALLEVSESAKQTYIEQASSVSANWLLDGLDRIQQAEFRIKQSLNSRLLLEVTLLNISTLPEKKNLSNPEEKPLPKAIDTKKKVDRSLQESAKAQSPEAQDVKPDIEAKSGQSENAEFKPESNAEQKPPPPSSESEKPAESEATREIQKHIAGKRRRAATKTISIQETSTMVETEVPSTALSESEPTKSIGSLALTQAWEHALESVAKDNNTLRAILARTDLSKLESTNSIRVELHHTVEQAEFDLLRSDLLEELRTMTGNSSLELTSELVDQVTTAKLFTPKDKYDHLAAKNPNLDVLKKKLDLDISF